MAVFPQKKTALRSSRAEHTHGENRPASGTKGKTLSTAYLLDTNILSESKKLRPNPAVLGFLTHLPANATYISCLSLGELRRGAVSVAQRNPQSGQDLLAWVASVEREYTARILPITTAIANLWGELSAGRTRPVIDTLLAATAIHHRLTLVTRNTRDVAGLPVQTINPWLPS